jgi:hypothetical protein
VGQYDRAANQLIGLSRIDSERHSELNRLVEFRERHFLCELNCLVDRVRSTTIDLRSGVSVFLP